MNENASKMMDLPPSKFLHTKIQKTVFSKQTVAISLMGLFPNLLILSDCLQLQPYGISHPVLNQLFQRAITSTYYIHTFSFSTLKSNFMNNKKLRGSYIYRCVTHFFLAFFINQHHCELQLPFLQGMTTVWHTLVLPLSKQGDVVSKKPIQIRTIPPKTVWLY